MDWQWIVGIIGAVVLIALLSSRRRPNVRDAAPRAARSGYSGPRADSEFRLNVAGVSFPNPDGTSRQAIIKRLRQGEVVRLVREPDNAHDPEAVAVWVDGGQIGYLPRGRDDLRRALDQGRLRATVDEITRPIEETGARGVALLIALTYARREVSKGS